MKVLGITGGVGCGKSTVLDILHREYRGWICQLDQTAKQLQKRNGACFEEIVACFGQDMIGEDGELDRKRLGDLVFADPEQLRRLNAIVHPAVKRQVCEEILQKEREGVLLFVMEAALLPSVGYEDICEEMWYVYAREDVRRRRLRISRGYTDERISQMMEAQPGEAEFRAACTAVIDNNGTLENTRRQIGELL